jgi:hypothetical protein
MKLPAAIAVVPRLLTVAEIIKREFVKRLQEEKSARMRGIMRLGFRRSCSLVKTIRWTSFYKTAQGIKEMGGEGGRERVECGGEGTEEV